MLAFRLKLIDNEERKEERKCTRRPFYPLAVISQNEKHIALFTVSADQIHHIKQIFNRAFRDGMLSSGAVCFDKTLGGCMRNGASDMSIGYDMRLGVCFWYVGDGASWRQ